ncbi:MAG: hypothetical protein AAGK00_00575 [Pseudomonadota bacterium]
MMYPQHPMQRGRGLGGTFSSLAFVAGIAGAIYLTPDLWARVQGSIWNWLLLNYAYEVATALWWGCQALAYCTVFQVTRTGLNLLLSGISLFALRRFFT